jgi:hypothetical protein
MASNPMLAYRKKKALAAAVRAVPVCQRCGNTFMAKRADAAFCSSRCRKAVLRKTARTAPLSQIIRCRRAPYLRGFLTRFRQLTTH